MAISLRSISMLPFLALACGQVLGIEDAHVDPTLLGPSSGRAGASGSGAGISGSDENQGGTNVGGHAGSAAGGTEPTVTAGTSGEGGSGGGDAGSGGIDAGPSTCDRYCDAIMLYCSGTLKQYRDREQCMAVCDLLPEGTIDAPDTNSSSCRLKYADKARYAAGTELGAYCRQSGPGGDSRCGSNCEGYCTLMMATCYNPLTAPYYYKSITACMSACGELPQIEYSYGDGTLADGYTLQCRLFHVTSAIMMDPEEHCSHAMGVALCEPPIEP